MIKVSERILTPKQPADLEIWHELQLMLRIRCPVVLLLYFLAFIHLFLEYMRF